ncbi:MAG: S8 family serine peptidase [Mycobacteriales bacterium]
MLRRTALLLAAALAVAAAPHASAAGGASARLPIVALIDSGVRASHHEFNYRGKASRTDQFAAWWDFTTTKRAAHVLPTSGQTWDTGISDPYDGCGHGTLTAGMVGGRNLTADKTPSAYPGAKLAIAKVVEDDCSVDTTVMAAAIRWATRSVHADVISMSIGSIVPIPAMVNQDVYDAITDARSRGVLVVVSNGNGWGDFGLLPGDPGWASSSAASPDALSVGAQGSTALINSTDPEVASVYSIVGPSSTSDTGYVSNGGTSFGTPYVAGFAAAVLLASRQGGHPLGVAALEQFVKDSSFDGIMPPQFEGYGVVGQAQLPAALANAKAGRRPTRPSPDLSGLYVDGVVGTLRLVWTSAT